MTFNIDRASAWEDTKYITARNIPWTRQNKVSRRFDHPLFGWDVLLSKIRSLFIQRLTFSSGIFHVDKQFNWEDKQEFIWMYPSSGINLNIKNSVPDVTFLRIQNWIRLTRNLLLINSKLAPVHQLYLKSASNYFSFEG